MQIYEVMGVWMDIVSLERGRPVGDREFGALLGEGLGNLHSFSRITILQWRQGPHEPTTDLLLDLFAAYHGEPDWRFYWTCDMLRAKKPEVFEAGLIKLPSSTFA
jgi:hypothetical protein